MVNSTKEQFFLITPKDVVTESFKGEITEEENKSFDKTCQPHPFNFKTTQQVYEKVGVASRCS
ncbi:hypothetical protein CCP3SC1AL1_2110006 [Gammaproteobacteria bacterium]